MSQTASSQSDKVTVSGEHEPNVTNTAASQRPQLLYVGVVFLIAIGMLVGILYSQNHKKKPQTVTAVCSSTFIKQSNSILQQPDTDNLGRLANTVEATKNYAQDPNCLYIVTLYYAAIGDKTQAASSLKATKAVYNANTGFSTSFSPPASLTYLESVVHAALTTTDNMQSTVESQL